ncbi:MAG: hypothetical protein HUU50_13635 [Candidatus Brocadiae bacterium]|nr:hypothetical protein [Candidatus Brocadiia bacterium]
MLSKKSFLCLFYNSIPIIFFLSFLFKPFFPDALQSLENLSHKKQLHEKKILGSYLDPLWYEHFRLLEKHIPIPLFFSSIPMDEDGFQNGISKDSTSLFVEYSKKAADSVQEGKYVHFKKSGKRKIEKVEIAWKPIYGIRRKYIKLYLEGTILSPYEDGYPYRIFLLDKDENKPTVWSTYSGIVEALLEVHNPDTDYIIHALGEKRRDKYVESFKKTKCDYAITIKNKWIYGNWLLSSNWDFYEQLVYNYDILCIAPSHVIWKKKKDAFLENQEQWEGTFRNLEDKKEFTLPLNRDGDNYDIIIIEAEYSIENPWKFFPFFNNFPRYFIDPVNASAKQTISLPPYKKVFRFPIFIKNKENPKLEFYVRSLLPGASLKIKEIRYRYFHAPQKTKEILFGIFE